MKFIELTALKNNNGAAEMNDFPCTSETDFVCEFNHATVEKQDKPKNFNRILKPLTEYSKRRQHIH